MFYLPWLLTLASPYFARSSSSKNLSSLPNLPACMIQWQHIVTSHDQVPAAFRTHLPAGTSACLFSVVCVIPHGYQLAYMQCLLGQKTAGDGWFSEHSWECFFLEDNEHADGSAWETSAQHCGQAPPSIGKTSTKLKVYISIISNVNELDPEYRFSNIQRLIALKFCWHRAPELYFLRWICR